MMDVAPPAVGPAAPPPTGGLDLQVETASALVPEVPRDEVSVGLGASTVGEQASVSGLPLRVTGDALADSPAPVVSTPHVEPAQAPTAAPHQLSLPRQEAKGAVRPGVPAALWADLLLAVLLVSLASLLVAFAPQLRGAWRTLLGLPALLLAPGYLMTLTFFPRRGDLSGFNRVILSLGYSLMSVPLLGLLLSGLPWGVTPRAMALGLGVWTLAWAGAAWQHRRRGPAGELFLALREPQGLRTVALFSVVSLGAIVGLGTLMGRMHSNLPLTEFYVLGPQGKLGDYPTRATPGTLISLTLAVRNFEVQPTAYRIRPSLCPRVIQVPTLAPQQEWRTTWQCRVDGSDATNLLRFDLFRQHDVQPYRTLTLSLE